MMKINSAFNITVKVKFKILIYIFSILIISSCSDKVYFTAQYRKQIIEEKNIPFKKLKFYVDRDVILRREMSSSETKASSGKVKFENGKYINIIKLPMNTIGQCIGVFPNKLNISFDDADSKFLTFGYPKNGNNDNAYQINADEWINQVGRVTYEGKTFYIQEKSSDAKIKIKNEYVDKVKKNTRVMKGRKIR